MNKALEFMFYILFIGMLLVSVRFASEYRESMDMHLNNQAEIIRLLQPDIAIDIVECEEINMPGYKTISPRVKK